MLQTAVCVLTSYCPVLGSNADGIASCDFRLIQSLYRSQRLHMPSSACLCVVIDTPRARSVQSSRPCPGAPGCTHCKVLLNTLTRAQEDVLNASALHFGYCAGDVVRFQILQGRLWVDFRTEREATGWYPMKNGPGVVGAVDYPPP